MSHRTYICLECRTSTGRTARYGDSFDSVRCPGCREEMWSLLWKRRIPKKKDDNGWRRLAQKVYSEAPDVGKYAQRLEEKVQNLEVRIEDARKMKNSLSRESKVKKLQAKQARLIRSRDILVAETKQAEPSSGSNL